MEILFKLLKVFWGIFALLLLVKIVLAYAPKTLDFSFIDSVIHKITEAKEDKLTFKLASQKGLVLPTIEGCIKEHKSGIVERGYSYDTQGQCMNGMCTLTVAFNQDVPKQVQLYVKKNDACVLHTFEVPKTLDTIGYQVNLQLSKSQKKHFGIHPEDEIRLEHANAYSFSGEERLYYYDKPLKEDTLLVNDAMVTRVHFSQ